jgi:1,2-diacylglycerol 3-alpha-glucosyltransferase
MQHDDIKIQPIKRLGILTNTYPPIRNGVSMAVKGLEVELAEKGIEVFIATPHVDDAVYADNVFTFEAVALPKDISTDLKLAPIYVSKVKKYFASKDVDLIHTSDTLFGGVEGAAIANELGIPCVHTFHTLIEDYQMVSFPAYKAIIRKGIKEICNSYDHVIAPSQKVYKYLLGLTMAPLSQIYNVSYLNSVKYIQTSKFDKLNIEPGDFVFITFCRLAAEKGLVDGIKTLSPILKHNPRIKYVIAGDGPQRDELENLVEKLEVKGQVIFVGGYSPDELQALVQKSFAKVFLFTSGSENLPTNILEAMYLGLPVVAIDDESVDYLVQHGVNGFKDRLENLFDYCIKLVYSDGLLQELSEGAKKTAVEFLEKDIAQEHINLYNSVIEDFYQEKKETKLIDMDKIFHGTLQGIKKLLS